MVALAACSDGKKTTADSPLTTPGPGDTAQRTPPSPPSPPGATDTPVGGSMDAGVGRADAGDADGDPPPPAADDDAVVEEDAGVDTKREEDLPPLVLPPPPATAELRAIPEALARATCSAVAACMNRALLDSLFGDDCVGSLTAFNEDGEFAYVQASIDDHRIVHDPTALESCTADIEALGCNVRSARMPASCESLLQGQVPVGQACVIDDDCAGANHCDRRAACPGVCALPGGPGAACAGEVECQSGLICFGGACASPRAIDQNCGPGFGRCRLGSVCAGADPTTGAPGICLSQETAFSVEDGSECDPAAGRWCTPDSACVVDVGEEDGQPVALTVCKPRAESGGVCHMPIAPTPCAEPDEYCPVDLNPLYKAICVPRPGQGERCGKRDVCATGLICASDDTCASIGRIGDRCGAGAQCGGGLCDGTRCVLPERCQGELRSYCGDTRCDPDEDCGSCAQDCGACPTCGDDACNGDETCSTCADDCGVCPPECGDDACNGDETCGTCADDCGVCPPACGDDACNGGETCSSCADDCGVCPAACGDDRCDPDEVCSNCAQDCGACPGSCGDGTCDPGESCGSCAADCGACPARCGDGSCQATESCESCAADCGGCAWPPAAGDDLDGLAGELASSICQAFDDCLLPPIGEILLGNGDCVARITADLEDGELVYLQDSLDAGRIVYDGAQRASCKSELAGLGCDLPLSRWPASCDALLAGQVSIGNPCLIDDDCSGDSHCDLAASCSGTCVARGADGDACVADGQCQSGLQCFGGACVVPSVDGEGCGPDVAPCYFGLLCIGYDAASGQAGTCMTQSELLVAGQNELCDPGSGTLCVDGLACVIDVQGEAAVSVCKARVASGQPCNLGIIPEQCPAGEYCPAVLPSYQSTCAARPGDGQACGVNNVCDDDLYCGTDGLCHVGKRLGQACTGDGNCYSERCDGGLCLAPDRCELPDAPVCGDDACTAGESCATCAGDCGCPSVCGSGSCDPDESCGSCPGDCGACPSYCGDNSCNGAEDCESCPRDCGACAESCGDGSCGEGETCAGCAADCGACEPVCGDGSCNGEEACDSCEADCDVCPTFCGDDTCDANESCESCAADCGACPAPYSGPCDSDGECAPSQRCAQTTVPGLFGLPAVEYGYCAEQCSEAADCSGAAQVRSCTPEGDCAQRCDVLIGVFDPAFLCPFGGACLNGICTWQR